MEMEIEIEIEIEIGAGSKMRARRELENFLLIVSMEEVAHPTGNVRRGVQHERGSSRRGRICMQALNRCVHVEKLTSHGPMICL